MKTQLNLGFVATYSGRWPRELPEQRNEEYGCWLEENFPQANVVRASQIACSPDTLEATVQEFKVAGVDLVVLVYGAFTGDDVAAFLAEMLGAPISLWAPYELPLPTPSAP